MSRTAKFRPWIPVLLALAAVASADQPSATPGMLGVGGRVTWSQSPLEDSRTWVDAQVLLRPLPRLFLAGTWGMADRDLRGNGADTTISELRWDLTVGVVVLDGQATGYVPFLWRHASERHSWWGDAHWTEIGAGAGVLWPVRDWLQMRSEALWTMPTEPHDELRLGPGRQIDGGHMELSLGFLIFVR